MNPTNDAVRHNESGVHFDDFAEGYNEIVNRSIAISGENRHYFARRRVEWFARKVSCSDPHVLDFGCGIGTTIPILLEVLGAARVVGADISRVSLEYAMRANRSQKVDFKVGADFDVGTQFDIAYCNGVFHHIPVEERRSCVQRIFRSLRMGGWLAFWENNPLNPGTRYCMRRNPFDRDALPLSSYAARCLLSEAGFEIKCIDFAFIFPRPLCYLRWFEPKLCRFPLGAQYLVLCQRPTQ